MMNNANTPSGIVGITPNDNTAVDLVGITVGGAGDVTVIDSLGDTTTVTMVAGQTLCCRIIVVKASGTTATKIVGFKA